MGSRGARMMVVMVVMTMTMLKAMAPVEAAGANDYVYGLCNTQSYEPNGTFALNLNKALGTLVEQAERSLYGNYTVAPKEEPNSTYVYAMYQCRGDASLEQCRSCVSQILASAPCGATIGTRIQYAACFLRYENYVYSSTQDFSLVTLNCSSSSSSTASGTAAYDADLAAALNNTAERAPISPLFFNASNVGTAYAVAQCLDYLPPSACRVCLSQVSDYSSFCPNSTSGYAYYVTCFFLFDNQPLTLT